MPLTAEALITDRYRLGEIIGGLDERRTWRAVDTRTGEHVIFKSLFFGPGLAWEDYRPFEREAAVLPTLDHPGIPPFRAAFWLEQPEGQYFCIVQKFVQGTSLAELLARGQRFEEEQLLDLTAQLLEILAYLHAQQPALVHRDIKPDNLILGEDGQVFLVDFGAVQAMGQSGVTLTAAGTFGYMAPEQLLGRAVPGSDVYGLGATLLQLLTGRPPEQLFPAGGGAMEMPEHPMLRGWFGGWLALTLHSDVSRRLSNGQAAWETFIELRNGGVSKHFVLPSDLKRFVVLKADAQGLRVDLMTPSSWRWFVNTFKAVVGLSMLGCFVLPLLDYLPSTVFGLASSFQILIFAAATLWLPPYGVRLEVKRDGCCLTQVIGDRALWRRVNWSGTQTELQVLGSRIEQEDDRVQRWHLRLCNGKQSHRFSVHLSARELHWVLEQFRAATLQPGEMQDSLEEG